MTNPGDDSSTSGDLDSGGNPDSTMRVTGDDGSAPDATGAPEAATGDDGSTGGVTPDGSAPPDGGVTPDGGTTDGGSDGGTCAGGCDDGNPCTVDTCAVGVCKHDGTGVTTAGCMPSDKCNSYKCDGDLVGTCAAVPLVDCSSLKDKCNAGVCDLSTGTCKKEAANEGGPCEDGNACTTSDTCVAGTCKGGPALSCDDQNPCTTDSCDTTLGCKNVNNTATCDDKDPCTVGDVCSAGRCAGQPKDCSKAVAVTDTCNVGVCNAQGNCVASPKADGTACVDTDVCATTAACKSGSCTGSGNSCGPNSSKCVSGPPKVCTCNTNYTSSGGQCVPDTNECDASPCAANATCNDPSSAVGDYVCTCAAGYTGDGKKTGTGCTLINNCVGNPCGAGLGTCVNGVNSYTCSCNSGYKSVNGTCACDMNGTFAQRFSLETSWSGITFFEDGTKVPSTNWALRTQTYDASGNLTIKTVQCGSTAVDLCGEFPLPVGNEAYGNFLPSGIFDKPPPAMPVNTLTISLPHALPGQAYVEPQTAVLFGISLTDPLGPWPAASTNVGAGANQTNGAIWIDSDGDGVLGVTNYVVPPGGISHTTPPLPMQDFGADSTACPRGNASLPRDAYAYLPGLEGVTVQRVKRTYTASRVISSMSGTISSCDEIQGTLGGPDNNEPQASARVGGCVRVNNGTGEINCSPQLASEYDGEDQAQHIANATFILKRVPSTTTCAQVRAMTF